MRALHVCAGVMALGFVAGCGAKGPSGGSATVQGSVSTSARPLDNARAVAVGADGRVFWAYLDARGAFTLNLPVGQSYRVLVANTLASGGQRTVGHLVVHPSTGATRWIGIHQAGLVALGALNVPGTAGAVSAGATLTTKDDTQAGDPSSSSSSSGAGDGSQEDVDTHEDDNETSSLCSSQGDGEDDDQELDAENDPGDNATDDDKSEHEQESENEDGAPCPSADAGSSGTSSSSGSGSGSSSGGTTAGGSVASGGACTVTANCSAGLVCAASICQPAIK